MKRGGNGIEHLRRKPQQSRGFGGQAFLLSGGSEIARERLLERISTEANLSGVRVITTSAREENAEDEALAAKIIRKLGRCIPGFAGELHDETDAGRTPDESSARPTKLFGPTSSHKIPLPGALKWERRLHPAVERAAASGLVLLVVEDLHQADPGSIEAVTALPRELPRMTALILATCPSRDGIERTGQAGLAEFTRLAEQIELGGEDVLRGFLSESLREFPREHPIALFQGSVPCATPSHSWAISWKVADHGRDPRELTSSAPTASEAATDVYG